MRPLTASSVSGAQSAEGGGSKVWIGSQTTTKTTAKNAISPPTPATSGVMSIRSGGCARPAARDPGRRRCAGVARLSSSLTGGATASATRSVSRRRRSAVSVNIVMPMFTIWTIPETTIIAPKIPRAM